MSNILFAALADLVIATCIPVIVAVPGMEKPEPPPKVPKRYFEVAKKRATVALPLPPCCRLAGPVQEVPEPEFATVTGFKVWELEVTLLIVATAVFDETHGFVDAGVPLPVNVEVPPTQALNVPVIVGSALTVMVIALEVAGDPVRQGLALDVITTVTTSPLFNVVDV